MSVSSEVAPVSAVVPCFRCADTIQRAVDSIINQTQKPAEVILVDDASGDDTLNVLHGLARQYVGWIKVVALSENQGPASARNAGWENASQPYIAFLDSDDTWHPEKIEHQLKLMIQNPDWGISGHAYFMKENNNVGWSELPLADSIRVVSKCRALLSNPFATRTVMLKRSLPFQFRNGKRYIEDYLLWLEIILSEIPAAFIDKPMAAAYKLDYGINGLSANLWKMESGELDTYWQIHRSGKIGLFLTLFLTVYSLSKYLRRIIFVFFYKLKSKL